MKKNKAREYLVQEYLSALKENTIPWVQDWDNSSTGRNAVTGKTYRGINLLILHTAAKKNGYEDNRWCTFNQASEQGWKIRKGSKGVPLEYWSIYDRINKRPISISDYSRLIDKEGRSPAEFRIVSNNFTVFNGDCIDGIPERTQDINSVKTYTESEQAAVIDKMVANMGVTIQDGDGCFYIPSQDTIVLYPKEEFTNGYGYLATKLHEMSHATGHESRLHRDMTGKFGSESYAKEELRAEISSSFVMQDLGLAYDQSHIDNHKAYIQSWISVLENDPNELFAAVKDADKIADYLKEQGEMEKEIEKPEIQKEQSGNVATLEEKEDGSSATQQMSPAPSKAEQLEEENKDTQMDKAIALAFVNDHRDNMDDWSIYEVEQTIVLNIDGQEHYFSSYQAFLEAYRSDMEEDLFNHTNYLNDAQIEYLGLSKPDPIDYEMDAPMEDEPVMSSPSRTRQTGINTRELTKKIEQQVLVTELATEAGLSLVKNGSTSFRTVEHDSLVFDTKNNNFYWNSRPPRPEDIKRARENGKRMPNCLSGGAITFFMIMNDKTYMEAIKELGQRVDPSIQIETKQTKAEKAQQTAMSDEERHKFLVKQLVEHNYQNRDLRRTQAYLIKTRKIEPEIVDMMIQRNMLFQTSDDRGRTQVAFVGRNENGLLASVCFRSTSSETKFKGDYTGCNYDRGWFFEPTKEIPFGWSTFSKNEPTESPFNTNKKLLVFESNIEMMSYMSILKLNGIDYRNYAYLSCGSITKSNCIEETCKLYGYKDVVVMFNNDFDKEVNAGLTKATLVCKDLSDKGYNARPLVPSQCNDWNDTLVAYKEKKIELKKDKEHTKKAPSLSYAR